MENTIASRDGVSGMWKRTGGSRPFLRGPSSDAREITIRSAGGETVAREPTGETLDRDAWRRLLSFLAITDANGPAVAYERVHERLVRFFRSKGSMHAEELADATCDRVACKLGRETLVDVRNPMGYFLGVARLIWLEWIKLEISRRRRLDNYVATCAGSDEDDAEAQTLERDAALLEHCLGELPPDQRMLLLHYYRGRGQARIARRQALVRELRLNPGMLRTRVHRLRAQLERRVNELRAAETPA